jgi:uncharacterized protein YbjT (DUF2867 family)
VRIALIGGTGLVGRSLLPLLAAGGHEVHAVQRRASELPDARIFEHVESPDSWPDRVRIIAPEAAISCLGTTMRQAGSRAAFRTVDRGMVLAFAAAAKAAGARRMLTVSSAGAAERAPVFYLALKGATERELGSLGFERLDIFRPGLLRGRRGPDRRLGERIGILFSPVTNLVLRGPLGRYAAIEARTVAQAMAAALGKAASGTFVHDNKAIRRLARPER